MMMMRSGPPRFKREAMVVIGLCGDLCRHYHDSALGKQRALWRSKTRLFISRNDSFGTARGAK